MVVFLKIVLVLFLVLREVSGTLTPDGTVSLDCGSQKTFTCSVTSGTALWNITGLMGISAQASLVAIAASTNARITDPISNDPSSSTLTITQFTEADKGGIIECLSLVGLTTTVDGMASISVDTIPSCPSNVLVFAGADGVNVTWQQPPNSPLVTFASVTFCPISSPNCGNSTNCTTSPCAIGGLDSGTEYQFTVLPNNYCGSAIGCTENNVTAETTCFCSVCTSEPTSILPTALAGAIPSAVLLLSNIISIVVAVFIARCCCNGTSQKCSPSKREDVHGHGEGTRTYEDITMTTSPAYGPVK